MKVIDIRGNKKIPTILFDSEKGLIEIKGRSIVENAPGFYEPLIDWLNDYEKKPQAETTVNIHMEYFNTSSSKWIFTIAKKLKDIYDKTGNVNVRWWYDDEDILEYIEIIQKVTKLPMELIPVEQKDDENL